MAQADDRTKREATTGGATGGGGTGADAVPPESPGNDQGGVVGSGWIWDHQGEAEGAPQLAGAKPGGHAESVPGMMGDGTEEQNLDQPGDPAARITEEEVDAAFAGSKPQAAASDEAAEPQEPVEGRPDR
jgi:hypothetical protein